MEIVEFEPRMAPDLARCYNELMVPVPYHQPAAEEWFVDLRGSCFQDCSEQAVLVARQAGGVAGFVHVGLSAPPTQKWHMKGEPGAIRIPCIPRSAPSVAARHSIPTAFTCSRRLWTGGRRRRKGSAGSSRRRCWISRRRSCSGGTAKSIGGRPTRAETRCSAPSRQQLATKPSFRAGAKPAYLLTPARAGPAGAATNCYRGVGPER